MSTTLFTVLTIAVPIAAFVAALFLARFADTVARGGPSRRTVAAVAVVLAIVYVVQTITAFDGRFTWRIAAYIAAIVFWSAVAVANVRGRSAGRTA